MSVNSRLKATKITGQGKHFIGREFQSIAVRKETVEIDILVASRNGDRKIMRSVRRTSRPTLSKLKWNQLSQF